VATGSPLAQNPGQGIIETRAGELDSVTIALPLFWTLALTTALFFVGQVLVRRSALLQRYSIPVPVVGGVLFAVALAATGLLVPVQFSVDESLKDPLLLAFFATLGLGADVRSLARGGWKLVILLVLFVALMVMQCAIGMVLARLMDLHPLVGLLGSSISLVGGHGTAAAYAASFAETRNLQGALELGMAAATAGLILGSVLAGPLAESLLRRQRTSSAVVPQGDAGAAATPPPGSPSAVFAPITAEQMLFVLLVCLLCIGGAHAMGGLMKGTGILLPDFLWALLIGMAVRNVVVPLGTRAGLVLKPVNDRAVQALGSVSLSLFLIMALMSMRLLDLATLAGPLILIVVVNAFATAAFAFLITYRAMGADRDAAFICAGQVAAGLATTAVGMSVMQTLTERHGPAPLAFLLIPIVGAFFADIANAIVLQAFFALPALGF
jgi:ESS family glutamate:Na+ symporter